MRRERWISAELRTDIHLCLYLLRLSVKCLFDSVNRGKTANLEGMVSGPCTTLSEHVISMRTSYFEIDFNSQMKFTKFPLIHCFVIRSTTPVFHYFIKTWNSSQNKLWSYCSVVTILFYSQIFSFLSNCRKLYSCVNYSKINYGISCRTLILCPLGIMLMMSANNMSKSCNFNPHLLTNTMQMNVTFCHIIDKNWTCGTPTTFCWRRCLP